MLPRSLLRHKSGSSEDKPTLLDDFEWYNNATQLTDVKFLNIDEEIYQQTLAIEPSYSQPHLTSKESEMKTTRTGEQAAWLSSDGLIGNGTKLITCLTARKTTTITTSSTGSQDEDADGQGDQVFTSEAINETEQQRRDLVERVEQIESGVVGAASVNFSTLNCVNMSIVQPNRNSITFNPSDIRESNTNIGNLTAVLNELKLKSTIKPNSIALPTTIKEIEDSTGSSDTASTSHFKTGPVKGIKREQEGHHHHHHHHNNNHNENVPSLSSSPKAFDFSLDSNQTKSTTVTVSTCPGCGNENVYSPEKNNRFYNRNNNRLTRSSSFERGYGSANLLNPYNSYMLRRTRSFSYPEFQNKMPQNGCKCPGCLRRKKKHSNKQHSSKQHSNQLKRKSSKKCCHSHGLSNLKKENLCDYMLQNDIFLRKVNQYPASKCNLCPECHPTLDSKAGYKDLSYNKTDVIHINGKKSSNSGTLQEKSLSINGFSDPKGLSYNEIKRLSYGDPKSLPYGDPKYWDIEAWRLKLRKEKKKKRERGLFMMVTALAIITFIVVCYFGVLLFLRITKLPHEN